MVNALPLHVMTGRCRYGKQCRVVLDLMTATFTSLLSIATDHLFHEFPEFEAPGVAV